MYVCMPLSKEVYRLPWTKVCLGIAQRTKLAVRDEVFPLPFDRSPSSFAAKDFPLPFAVIEVAFPCRDKFALTVRRIRRNGTFLCRTTANLPFAVTEVS